MWYACYMYYLFGMPLSRKAVFGLGAKPTNDKDHCALLIGALVKIICTRFYPSYPYRLVWLRLFCTWLGYRIWGKLGFVCGCLLVKYVLQAFGNPY